MCVDRVVMCLMCGDEYKVDVPLSPLLNHTSVDVCVDRVVMCLSLIHI